MNEMSEMAAVIKAEAEFFSVAGKATKQMLLLIRNFMKLMFKDIGYNYIYKKKYLGKKSGKTRKGNLNKISREWQFVKLPNHSSAIKQFNKCCKKLGIPYTQIKGIDKLMPDGESNYIHIAYPAADAVRMKAAMQMFQEFWVKYNKNLQNSTDNVKENAGEIIEGNVEDTPMICIQAETFEECAMALGCNCSCKEFDAAFAEQYPEASKEIERLTKTIPDIEKKREVVIDAMKKNKQLPENLSGHGVMKFARKQIIGGKIIGNELFVQFVSPLDPTKAVELPLKNMIHDNSGGITVFMPENALITIYNINGEDNREQYYMSDIVEAARTGKTITPYVPTPQESTKEQKADNSKIDTSEFMRTETEPQSAPDTIEPEQTPDKTGEESEHNLKESKVAVDIPDDVIPITINETLIIEETSKYYKTRVPGTFGDNICYLMLEKKDVKIVDNGKTYMYNLNYNQDYKLYGKDGNIACVMNGMQLYDGHYDFNKNRKYYETKSKTDNGADKDKKNSKPLKPAKKGGR